MLPSTFGREHLDPNIPNRFSALGSALSLRSLCRQGSSTLSTFNFADLGSSLSTRTAARFGSRMSVFDFLNMGSTLSVRGYARISSSVSVQGLAKFGSCMRCSLIDCLQLGSSLSVRRQALVTRDRADHHPNFNIHFHSEFFRIEASHQCTHSTQCRLDNRRFLRCITHKHIRQMMNRSGLSQTKVGGCN